jgi:hypothetical protein
VNFTLLPAGFAEASCAAAQCTKGDANGDNDVDTDDIPGFVDTILRGYVTAGSCEDDFAADICRFDMNLDCLLNGLDIQGFTDVVLGGTYEPAEAIVDCNGNSVADSLDIANETSNDVDGDGIPDECQQPDCDHNGVPDDWELLNGATDCNSNGDLDVCEPDCNSNDIADACDIATDPSLDCNSNGVIDACEPATGDCNSNGVPDSCDIAEDPTLDCNSDGVPDSCNLAIMPPMGSTDCNDNDVPDECDIASNFSEDSDSDGIPDECEGEGMMGGGSSMMSGGEGGGILVG